MRRSRKMRTWLGFTVVVMALLAVGFYAHSQSLAQQQSIDDLLNQLGTDQTDTGTDTTVPADGTTTEPPSAGSGSTRQPIVENQFSAARSGELARRSPGIYVQQGLAEATGNLDLLVGDAESEPGFYFETFEMIFLSITSALNDLISTLSLGFALGGTGGTDGGLTLDNAVTTGQGTTTTLD